MVPRGLAKRYATALFNTALKANQETQLRDEALAFHELFQTNPEFKKFILSPQVLTDKKKHLLDVTIKERASDLFVRFLKLLIDKKRIFYVDEIIDAYNYLYERHEGILEVKAITAVPLDESMEQRITTKIASETGRKIRLMPSVDPEIIAGVVLILEDRIIDGSVRHHLQTLRRELDQIRIN